jgi:hypothetical protein
VQAFTTSVACETCGSTVSGSPLVKAVTDYKGQFTITNMPVGTNIPLVIQTGRWRRQVKIPTVTSCTTTAVAASLTRLPRTQAEGDIPSMAFATGAVDALECVLRKIGVADSEFTLPVWAGGTGRISLYTGLGNGGATINGDNAPTEDNLWGDPSWPLEYDIIFFPCQGDQYDQATSDKSNIVSYTNAGGRIFTTHYSYVWLYDVAPFRASRPTRRATSTRPSPKGSSSRSGSSTSARRPRRGRSRSRWCATIKTASSPPRSRG